MKRNISINIILAALAAVFLGGFFILKANAASKPEASFAPKPGDAIVSLAIKNNYGEFNFIKIDDSGLPEEGWLVEAEGAQYRANAEKMKLLLTSFADIEARRFFAGEIPAYGFASPQAEVRFETASGKTYDYVFGAGAADYNAVYVKNAAGVAALAESFAANQATGNLAAYRDKQVFTVNLGDIAAVSYSRGGEKIVECRRTSSTEWNMVYPWQAPARHIELTEFVAALSSWIIAGYPDSSLIDDDGLEPPLETLTLTDNEGRTQVLGFGATDGIGRFARIGGDDDVVLLYAEDAEFSVLEPERLLFIAPLRAVLDEAAGFRVVSTVAFKDGNYAKGAPAQWDFSYEPDEGAYYWTDEGGYPLEAEDYVRVFVKFISMTADGRDEAGLKQGAGNEAASLMLVRFDGKKTAVELSPRDEKSFFMRIDGENTPYYINAERLEGLLRRINGLAESLKAQNNPPDLGGKTS